MTSSISSSFSQAQFSPRDILQSTLSSGISSGKIKSADKSALSSALDSIDQSLSSGFKGSGINQAPSRDSIASKIDGLISDQVNSGKLTSNQATELKQVFQDTFSKGPGGASGGFPPGGLPDFAQGGGNDLFGVGGNDSSSSGSSNDVNKLLQDLLKQLSDSSSSNSYNFNAKNTKNSLADALFVDSSV